MLDTCWSFCVCDAGAGAAIVKHKQLFFVFSAGLAEDLSRHLCSIL